MSLSDLYWERCHNTKMALEQIFFFVFKKKVSLSSYRFLTNLPACRCRYWAILPKQLRHERLEIRAKGLGNTCWKWSRRLVNKNMWSLAAGQICHIIIKLPEEIADANREATAIIQAHPASISGLCLQLVGEIIRDRSFFIVFSS
jgi:hypothetical protein